MHKISPSLLSILSHGTQFLFKNLLLTLSSHIADTRSNEGGSSDDGTAPVDNGCWKKVDSVKEREPLKMYVVLPLCVIICGVLLPFFIDYEVRVYHLRQM